MKLPSSPSFSLKNKNALVVGGSSGIGLGCAVALADYGANVTIAARRTDEIKKLSDELNERGFSTSYMTLNINNVNDLEEKNSSS
jgi:NAD(P)-dependent dehydrogenase (short-subunit alcohol dehydrogenase family)